MTNDDSIRKDCLRKELCLGPYWCEYAEFDDHDKVLSHEDDEDE